MPDYLERTSMNWSRDSIRLIETASPHTKQNYLYVQEAGYFKTTYPYFTERQNLSSYLIVYTISGCGKLHYQGSVHTLTSGMLFLIDCTQYHYYKCSLSQPWEILWIHFNGINASGYYTDYIKNDFQILSLEDSFVIESSMRRIISLHQKKERYREVISSGIITSILIDLILLSSPDRYFSNHMPSYIKELKLKLEQNYASELSLEVLEQDFHRSRFSLVREFKRYTGSSIHDYVISCRISKAKELLKYSDLTVSHIALKIGVPNVSHFINLFKAREGTTPLQFRKEWGRNRN